MSDFPEFKYSMKEVREAGKALSGQLIWTDETADYIRRVFAIAHNWRDAHSYPMSRLRSILSGQIQRQHSGGDAVARLKRMPSIRGKLRRQPSPLDRIQDLAGCRAILPSINDAAALINAIRQIRHVVDKENPYIERPKADGYRCHHMVFRFQGKGDEAVFNDRRIEVQIRTWLQHSWATAVEAVGAYRGENMKAGEGDPDWLRLFVLMSAEFAATEKCAEPPNVPIRSERVKEIIELDKKLDAAITLENITHIVKYSDNIDPKSNPEFYQINYDRKKRVVDVTPYFNARAGATAYDEAEVNADKAQTGITSVLVEADGIENLKAAYPNYFGDVQKFAMQLKSITQGDAAVEYTMLPRTAPMTKKPYEKPDPRWIGRSPFYKPDRRRR
jgi:Region found in RelA / SpoT proteins